MRVIAPFPARMMRMNWRDARSGRPRRGRCCGRRWRRACARARRRRDESERGGRRGGTRGDGEGE